MVTSWEQTVSLKLTTHRSLFPAMRTAKETSALPTTSKSSNLRKVYLTYWLLTPLTAGGHVTSLSRHVSSLRRALSTWGDRFSRMSSTWKLLAYNSRFIPRNDTKILWSKSLSINRGTNSGEMLNLINPTGSWKQMPIMAAVLKWRP